jgi:predicted signal transduction protein with EAL and GGDEF domain
VATALVVGASIGVAVGPAAAAGGLLAVADAAMYATKRHAKATATAR